MRDARHNKSPLVSGPEIALSRNTQWLIPLLLVTSFIAEAS
jgi:hypothetical protein